MFQRSAIRRAAPRGAAIAAAAGLIGLAACARPPAEPLPAALNVRGWHCADGSSVLSRGLERAVELRDGAAVLTLRQVAAASGARYEDGRRLFWNRGDSALLSRDGSPPLECRENRRLSLYEDARSRGVRLRAQGNEPGWVLEIGPGAGALLDNRYGRSRLAFERLTPLPGGGYEGVSGGIRMRVEIRDERCIDDMSGEAFAVAVRLRLGEETRRGCGERLRR